METTPAKPTGLTASTDDGEVGLLWDDPDDTTITGYDYAQSTDGGDSFDDWQAMSSDSVENDNYTVSGLTNGTGYTFKIRASNANGDGPESDAVSATPIARPIRPASPTASGGNRAILISWHYLSNRYVAGYQYQATPVGENFLAGEIGDITQWDSGPDTFGVVMSSTTISTATSHDGELVPSTSYQVRIQSYVYNNSGVRLTSPWSTTINATPYGPKPAKPTGLYPFTDDSQISLLWHSPVDNTITSYQYALSTDGGESFDDWQDMTALAVKYKSYLLTGLTNGTEYTIKIRAVNDDGDSPESDTVSGTPIATPSRPTGLSATGGNGVISITWDDPENTDIVGCPASTIFAGWRQSVLPVHLLGLAPLLGSIGPVAGDVKLQDDGVVHDPVNRRGGGHGVGEDALPLREDQV